MQRIILLVCYTTTIIALFIPLARLVNRLSPDNLFPLAVILIIYLLLSVVIGTFIYFLSYIPFNLATAFDPIKNEIASGNISDLEQFGKRITDFTTQFFDFSFLDIAHAVFQTEHTNMISHEDISQIQQALKEHDMLENSKKLEEIIRAGKINLNGKHFHLYILPLWFGDRWLGYLGLLSSRRINRFFQKLLMEFENNFIDDQLMHMIHISKKN